HSFIGVSSGSGRTLSSSDPLTGTSVTSIGETPVRSSRPADYPLLHRAGHQVSIGVVDRAPRQAAVPGDALRLLGIEVPAVEADWPVEPQRVVHAEGDARAVREALQVGAQ